MGNLGTGEPEDSLSESVGKRKIEAVIQTKTCVGIWPAVLNAWSHRLVGE